MPMRQCLDFTSPEAGMFCCKYLPLGQCYFNVLSTSIVIGVGDRWLIVKKTAVLHVFSFCSGPKPTRECDSYL